MKALVTITVTAIFLSALGVVSVVLLHYARTGMKQVLADQQLAFVSRVANDIDEKMIVNRDALAAVAKAMSSDAFADAPSAQRWLSERSALNTLFNDLFVISRRGAILADAPPIGRGGIDVSDQPYFQRTVATRAPQISEPFLGRFLKEPVITMSAPVLDGNGEVVGVLTGTLNLLRPNFLGNLANARVGKTGTFAVFTRDRMIVISAEKQRILSKGPPPGVSPYFDRATAGEERSEEAVNSRGLHAIYSYHQLETVPWVVVASLPVAEAYAPIRQMVINMAALALLMGVLAAVSIWYGVQRWLDPLQERVTYLAHHDSLTGVANRLAFFDRLGVSLESAGHAEQRAAVLIIDIDRFKDVNDSLSRSAGDELLKQVAARLRGVATEPTRVARISADRFAILRPNVTSEDEVARHNERKMRAVFEPPFHVAGSELRISAKVGIAVYPTDGTNADTLFRNAESALARAKTTGNAFLFYRQEMSERTAQRLSMEGKLRLAIEREEFVLHYQPKVHMESGAVVAVEALIRWQSPEKGLVPPVEFIPLLEEIGLIHQVGFWALQRALRDQTIWARRGKAVPRVAVNVSAVQLRQADFVEVVARALRAAEGRAALDLEITESLLMDDIQGNIEKLDAIRKLGVDVAIDDFGTGYSSLGYLAQLPIQALKIDRSFVIPMKEDANAMTLVTTIISLAHSLGLKVIAEGVETGEHEKLLRLLRCDEMQGYLVSKPLPSEKLIEFLESYVLDS